MDSLPALAQGYKVDTIAIREVVVRWNESHQEGTAVAFEDLYAPVVLFYTQSLARQKCIQQKLSELRKNPSHQRIASDLQLTFYEDGIVYCAFNKEVGHGNGKMSTPSYLLLKRVNDKYVITGEGDLITDRNKQFHLSLGLQISTSELLHDRLPKQWKLKPWLVAGLLIILGAAGVYYFRKKPVKKAVRNVSRTNNKSIAVQEAANPDLAKGHAFEQFVVNRFRQSSDAFRWMDATSDKGVAGHFPASNLNPDLQYEFRTGDKSYAFAVECKYRSGALWRIRLTRDDQIARYRKFSADRQIDVFIVLGVGGSPTNPLALFVIPLSEVSPVMDSNELEAFHAKPSFYYDPKKRRLY